jgi:hypothetical protein
MSTIDSKERTHTTDRATPRDGAQALGVMKSPTPAAQLAKFIGRYSPEIARAFEAARRKMRAHVPRGYELVYDNYNALGIGYGPGQKSSDVIVSIVAYPRWVTLFFLRGADLEDSQSLLQGTGKQVRRITLGSPDDLDESGIRELIAQALAPHSATLASCPRIRTVIKSAASKRRPRRP